MINPSEIQYFNVLKRIIIENIKDEGKYLKIKNDYLEQKLSLEEAYDKLLKISNNNLVDALNKTSNDRTGTGTYKVSGASMEFDLTKGFPLLTTKKVFTKGIFEELFWFIKGDTNVKALIKKGVNIWTPDAFRNYIFKNNLKEEYPINSEKFDEGLKWFTEQIKSDKKFAKKWGELGPVYGAQWRNFGGHDPFKNSIQSNLNSENPEFLEWFNQGIKKFNLKWNGDKGVDQLGNMVEKLKSNPYDRRNLVFAYNPNEVDQQVLPACHSFFQAIVREGVLSLAIYIRSNDMFLGSPFNIASYAALTHMLAQVSNLKVGKLIYFVGDAHIYANHIDAVQEQLSRTPKDMPQIKLDPTVTKLEDFDITKIEIINYNPESSIKARISV